MLVDAADFARHAADPLLADTLARQLRAADLLVINHRDRAAPAALDALRAHLDATLPRTPRVETTHAMLPPALLGLADEPVPPVALRAVAGSAPLAAHDLLFETRSFPVPGPLDASALRALLRAMPAGTLRLKGLVRTDEHGAAVLQFAGTHGSLRRAPSGTPAPEDAAVVAIGLRGRLPGEALAQALAAARAGGGPD